MAKCEQDTHPAVEAATRLGEISRRTGQEISPTAKQMLEEAGIKVKEAFENARKTESAENETAS